MTSKRKLMILASVAVVGLVAVTFAVQAATRSSTAAKPPGPVFEPIASGVANVLTKTSYEPGTTTLDLEKATIPVGGVVPWHCHPGPTTFIVVQGQLTTFAPDGASRVLKPGEADVEQVGTARMSKNLGTKDVVVYILFAPPKGSKGTIWLSGPDATCPS
jgi:quercetin dioxygenase-like cupin family protein